MTQNFDNDQNGVRQWKPDAPREARAPRGRGDGDVASGDIYFRNLPDLLGAMSNLTSRPQPRPLPPLPPIQHNQPIRIPQQPPPITEASQHHLLSHRRNCRPATNIASFGMIGIYPNIV